MRNVSNQSVLLVTKMMIAIPLFASERNVSVIMNDQEAGVVSGLIALPAQSALIVSLKYAVTTFVCQKIVPVAKSAVSVTAPIVSEDNSVCRINASVENVFRRKAGTYQNASVGKIAKDVVTGSSAFQVHAGKRDVYLIRPMQR